jgi:hypothetical protein
MRWRVEPRFDYGLAQTRIERRAGCPVATSGNTALAVCGWNAGPVEVDEAGIAGRLNAVGGHARHAPRCRGAWGAVDLSVPR